MEKYKQVLKEWMCGAAKLTRRRLALTQEAMAEQLRITGRSYGNLERGTYCVSAVTLMFFLCLLSDEDVLGFRDAFKTQAYQVERQRIV